MSNTINVIIHKRNMVSNGWEFLVKITKKTDRPNLSANHPPKNEPTIPPGINIAVVRDHKKVR